MPTSPRIPVLAAKIAEHIRAAGLAPGTRLTERALAEQFDMSRTPVKLALRLLADRGMLRRREQGGFVVCEHTPRQQGVGDDDLASEEDHYLALAQDHLAGRVPARNTENALIRRYGLTRHEVARVLHRAAREGWAERLPGHGWRLLPMLASTAAYSQAYRFRLLIEPAGILEPGFTADRPALLACRVQHIELLQRDPAGLFAARMFDTASAFHELVMRCSGNPFLIEGLTRLNRLRRLMEYGKSVDRQAWLRRCAQHVAMIDLILAGELEEAAGAMRLHLNEGAISKDARIDERACVQRS